MRKTVAATILRMLSKHSPVVSVALTLESSRREATTAAANLR
jgi:hypothetical protein